MAHVFLEQSPQLAALFLLLGCSAFFSGSETALFSLTREELHRLRREGARSALLILRLLDDPQGLLSVILFGNMIVNVAFFSISAFVLAEIARTSSVAAAVVGAAAPLMVIVFGEVSPKGIAVGHPLGFARVVAPPLYVFGSVVRPIGAVLKWIAHVCGRVVLARLPRPPSVTREELKTLTGMAERHGVLDRHTRGMIEQVVELARIPVNEVMTPRVDMVIFDIADSRETLCDLIRRSHESRIPACRESRDDVIGFIRARDVFLDREKAPADLVRPLQFVPETQTVESLIRRLQGAEDPVAVVVDEYGGTSGWVTLEHLIEEIVGDIRGEFEPEEEPVKTLDEDTYLLAGDLNTHEWRQLLGVGFDPPGIETVAGFVTSLLGRIAREGDAIEWRGLRFAVVRMTGRRIRQVRVERIGREDES